MKEDRKKLREMLRQQRKLGLMLLAVGVLAMLASVPFWFQARRFNDSASRAPGEIVDMERQGAGKDISYSPVFSFVDQAGVKRTVHSRTRSNPPAYAVGDRVEVLYPADDPESARLKDFLSLWGLPAALGGAGLILALAGIVLWYYAVASPVDQLAAPPGEI